LDLQTDLDADKTSISERSIFISLKYSLSCLNTPSIIIALASFPTLNVIDLTTFLISIPGVGSTKSLFFLIALAEVVNPTDAEFALILDDDLATLAKEWLDANKPDYDTFISEKLKDYGKDKRVIKPIDVVLFGFGRIGRLAARELIQQHGNGEQLRLRAIVTRGKNTDEEIKKTFLFIAQRFCSRQIPWCNYRRLY